MIYNHFSELPIDAFKPSFGSMKLYGGGNPISDLTSSVSDAVSNVGESISNTVSNAAQDIGSVGNQIDQTVNDVVPGGWATVGSAALAAATMGGSLAAEGAVGAADAAAMAAPAELDATGTLAATAADTGAGGAGALAGTDAGLSAIPTATDTGLSMVPPEEIAPTPTGSELDPTGSLVDQANPSLWQQAQNAYSTLPGYTQSALSGAAKGMGTNALVNTAAGRPVTAQGLITSGLAGGVGGGIAGATNSSLLGGLAAVGTNALINKQLTPTVMASALPSLLSSSNTGYTTGGNTGGNTGYTTGSVPTTPSLDFNPHMTRGSQITLAGQPVFSDQAVQATPDYLPSSGSLSLIQNAAEGGRIGYADGGVTRGSSISLVNEPTFTSPVIPMSAYTPPPLAVIQNAAEGGMMGYADGGSPVSLRPQITRGNPQAVQNFTSNIGRPATGLTPFQHHKEGGEIEGHNPEFYSEGGLKNTYVTGDGDGTSDSIPAMLANGEFVIPADVVSGLGNGSNDSGAEVLDQFLKTIRQHKRHADTNHLPPDSKGALAYLLEAQKKVK